MKLTPSLLASVFLAVLAFTPSQAESQWTLRGHKGYVQCLCFSPDGTRLITGSADQSLKLWEVTNGEMISTVAESEGEIISVDFHPKESALASCTSEGVLKLRDASTGKVLPIPFESPDEPIMALKFHPSGARIAAGSLTGKILYWDTVTGKFQTKIDAHSASVRCVAFSQDGTLLASSSEDQSIKIWHVETGRLLKTLSAHTDAVLRVVFSPNGNHVVSGSEDGLLKIWDVASGQEIASMSGNESEVSALAYSPKGEWIASGNWNGKITLWDASRNIAVFTSTAHTDYVRDIAFNPDGTLLATGSDDGTAKLWDINRIQAAALAQIEVEKLFEPLFQSARLLKRRPDLLPKSTSLESLAEIAEKSYAEAVVSSDELRSNLNTFIESDESNDFKAENNDNFKSAQQNRDTLLRHLLIMQAVANRAAESYSKDPRTAELIRNTVFKWREISESFLNFFPDLAGDTQEIEQIKDLKRKAWLKSLRVLARRNVFTSEELQRAAPSTATIKQLSQEDQNIIWHTIAQLHCLDSNYAAVLTICQDLAVKDTAITDAIASEAIESFALPPEYAGRSENSRGLAESLRASDFGSFVQGLAKVPNLTAFRSVIPTSFASFCVFRRTIQQPDFEAALQPLQERSQQEIADFTNAMLKLLADVNTPSPKGSDATKKVEGTDWAAKIGEEYHALYQVIEAWQAKRPTWQTDLLRARIRFAWAKHQLGYVELDEPATTMGSGDKKATATDANGYRAHMSQWKQLMQSASTRLLDDSSPAEANVKAFTAVLSNWFDGLLDAKGEPAFPPKDGEDILTNLGLWVQRIPSTIRDTLLNVFAQEQVIRLDAPPGSNESDGTTTIKHEHRRQFVSMLCTLVGETEVGSIFKDIESEYQKLADSIQFYAIPDGETYEQGNWTAGVLPSVAVEPDEFGIWFTLIHTTEARTLSGGFHRYARGGSSNFSADEYPYLSETERTRYAEDFQRYLEHQVSEIFEVVLVAPHSQPEVCRTFQKDGSTWNETPLYYAILRPRGGAFPAEIPPLRLDLDFGHPQGRIVLPFHSQRVPLRLGKGEIAHIRDVSLRQDLNDLRRDQGELTLTITSESLGLPPRPHRNAINLPPPGYILEGSETQTSFKVLSFPGTTPGVRIQRSTVYNLRWQGTGFTSTFPFPTYTSVGKSETWQVDDFLLRPGQIKERHIPGGNVDLYGLPWHWGHLTGWLSKALNWGGAALGGGLGIWLTFSLIRRLKVRPKRPFPFTKPSKATPLSTANFLRRLASSSDLSFSDSQLERLRDDVEKLEILATMEDPSLTTETGPLLDKWFTEARQHFVSGLQ